MRLLYAEDDRQLRAAVARGLREASYEVHQAGTGTRAFALATAREYDAILLDVLLPGRSGVLVCRALRERGSRVPILMLTALDAVEDRIVGLNAGADDYLTKPFDFGELLARLRALTRRSAERPLHLMIGDLELDLERHTAHRGQREIALTSREFEFLLYLARHRGRVVSRPELMSHVWEEDRRTYTNLIDVYASRLRRKINRGASVDLFRTVRGEGFILDAPVREAGGQSSGGPHS